MNLLQKGGVELIARIVNIALPALGALVCFELIAHTF